MQRACRAVDERAAAGTRREDEAPGLICGQGPPVHREAVGEFPQGARGEVRVAVRYEATGEPTWKAMLWPADSLHWNRGEQGASELMLMAKSRHKKVENVRRYFKPSAEAIHSGSNKNARSAGSPSAVASKSTTSTSASRTAAPWRTGTAASAATPRHATPRRRPSPAAEPARPSPPPPRQARPAAPPPRSPPTSPPASPPSVVVLCRPTESFDSEPSRTRKLARSCCALGDPTGQAAPPTVRTRWPPFGGSTRVADGGSAA